MAKQVTINSTFFFLLFFPISDEPHGPLVLAIEPYQDQASGCPVTELDGKVAWVGTLQVHTPEVVTCGDVFAVFCLWGGEGWGRGTGWGKKNNVCVALSAYYSQQQRSRPILISISILAETKKWLKVWLFLKRLVTNLIVSKLKSQWNLALSAKLIMWNGLRELIWRWRFKLNVGHLDSLWWRTKARNVTFRFSLRCPITI